MSEKKIDEYLQLILSELDQYVPPETELYRFVKSNVTQARSLMGNKAAMRLIRRIT